jgi:hypothetical protein
MNQRVSQEIGLTADTLRRQGEADKIPFFLRSWWLRDTIENDDLSFAESSNGTQPIACIHSDPFCDASNFDTFMA